MSFVISFRNEVIFDTKLSLDISIAAAVPVVLFKYSLKLTVKPVYPIVENVGDVITVFVIPPDPPTSELAIINLFVEPVNAEYVE